MDQPNPTPHLDLVLDMPRIWITADQHFGHANIVGYVGRPFPVQEQDSKMAEGWRETVPTDAPLLHLGDLVVGSASDAIWGLIAVLPGRPKWLVRGNHDRPHRIPRIEAVGFRIIALLMVSYRGWLIRLTHRPISDGELGDRELNVHGPTHSRSAPPDLRWINVSVEATEYRPVRLQRLLDDRIERLSRFWFGGR